MPERTYLTDGFGLTVPKFMENGSNARFYKQEGVDGVFAELIEPDEDEPYWSARRTHLVFAIRAAEQAAKRPPSFYKEKPCPTNES